MQPFPLTFETPAALAVGLLIATATVCVGAYRRPALPPLSTVLGVVSLLLLAAAAGSPVWRGAVREEVAVMVDLSPSTRGASYRDVATLRRRVSQLLGDTPYRTVYFAAGDAPAPAEALDAGALPDVRAAQTTWSPPAAAAVLLFSDARFEVPSFAPPTFVVADPGLETPADAALERMGVRGGGLTVTARNAGGSRALTLSAPGSASERREVPPGGAVVTRPIAAETYPWTARLAPADLWPENDSLSLIPPPPAEAERWWVGNGTAPPGTGWRALSPAELPPDAAAYLRPSVIVLDNVAATDLDDAALRRLREYVTDLGGGLVVLGGDAAFAAGAYAGTTLDALSPLASHPPEASTHWIFLIDSSGSMGARISSGGTRWSAAVDAAARAAASLPPQDLVSFAGFAAGLDWWLRGKAASDLARDAVPPPDARPSGPTELRRALESAASGEPAVPPVELIVLTDANAPVEDAGALAAAMRANRVRLHLLDIGDGSGAGLAALRQAVEATGGTPLRESDPQGWAAAVRRLTRSAAPDLLVREPAPITFTGPLANTPARTVGPPWNRTWLKSQAAAVAAGPDDKGPLAASWPAGEGWVAAAAFPVPAGGAPPFVGLAERPPRDPRLRVTWDAGAALRVSVEATGTPGGTESYLNGLPLTLALRDATSGGAAGAPTVAAVPQVAPGRYEASVPAPTAPAIATLRRGGQAVDRIAVAGRYPAEFDRIGNDRRAMRTLAERTGGWVVEPTDTSPLGLKLTGKTIPLTPAVATAAAACLAAALIRWRAG